MFEEVLKKLPGLNCGSCGFNSCEEMARAIIEGRKKFEDCKVINVEDISIEINGEKIFIGEFVRKMLKKTFLAMISSLKTPEIKEGDVIEIRIKIHPEDIGLIKYGRD